jgi:hypothetical protein
MWYLYRKVILTKDNLAKRNWNGCKKSAFCDANESINHLFFNCPFASLIFGELLIILLTTPNHAMLQICLEIGLIGWIKQEQIQVVYLCFNVGYLKLSQ